MRDAVNQSQIARDRYGVAMNLIREWAVPGSRNFEQILEL